MPKLHYSAANPNQYVLVCNSPDIASGDISRVLGLLRQLSGDRASAMSANGAVTLVFHGFDDDPRELEAIPELRAWFRQLSYAWPYWTWFACRTDQTVPLMMALLLNGHQVQGSEPGMVGYAFDTSEFVPLLQRFFNGQDELVDRLEISEAEHERATTDFFEATATFMG